MGRTVYLIPGGVPHTREYIDCVSVCRFKLHRVPGAQQNRVHGFHGLGTDFTAKHVDRHDGQHVRARNRTERKRMDETSRCPPTGPR